VATDVKVYFCDPQSPWQRGSNENTNGLLRQYFPKNTDLTDYSQSDLNKVAQRLNQRPRQTLGFHTPASKLQESLRRPIETTRLTRQVELILKELLPSRPSLGNNCQGARSAACGVLPNSRGKVRSPKGEGRPPR
jgi:hypothetical protein